MSLKKKPAFGIVGTPTETARAAGGARVAVDAAAHGFVPREQLRTDRAADDPVLDACAAAANQRDWRAVVAAMPPIDGDTDRCAQVTGAVADLAVRDDSWLNAWLEAAPSDARAWAVHGQAMTRLAWELRTAAAASDVLPEQWTGFRRVLGQAPAAVERAVALAPRSAVPWIAMMPSARGLGWNHDRFREIWANAFAIAPDSVALHMHALPYWLPRWRGSDALAASFVADTMARARPGTLLTGVRLDYIFLERVPDDDGERAAFYRGAELAEALNAAIDDLRAAPSSHPYVAAHRHLLAYFLTKAGRYAEAVGEFRALGGCVGARPWQNFADPAGEFSATRAEALLGWQHS